MRKVKTKKLRQLARRLVSPEALHLTSRKIYQQLKGMYKDGSLPKDLRIIGE